MEKKDLIDPRMLFSDPALIDESNITEEDIQRMKDMRVKKKTHVVSVSIPVSIQMEYEVHLDEYFGDDWDDEDIRLKAIDIVTDREVDMVDKHGGDVVDGDYDHHYASVFLHTNGSGRVLSGEVE